MGIEGEDFIGNPNRADYTDDELADDDSDEVRAVLWFRTEDDTEDEFTLAEDHISNFFHEDVDYEDDDDEEYIPEVDDFLTDDDDDDDSNEGITVRLIDGVYVPVFETRNFNGAPVATQEGSDIDNNELLKTGEADADGASSEDDGRLLPDEAL